MRYKKWIIPVNLFLVIFLICSQVYAEGMLEKKHQDWESRVVVNGERGAFRALTISAEADPVKILTIDRHPNECGKQTISMTLVLDKPAKSSFKSQTLFGMLRVDEAVTHNINYMLNVDAGEKVAFITVTNFDKETTLLDEFIAGRTLRFKLMVESKEYYYQFSLLGFTAASKRTLELCNEYNAYRSEKGSIDEKVKVKSDKEYF